MPCSSPRPAEAGPNEADIRAAHGELSPARAAAATPAAAAPADTGAIADPSAAGSGADTAPAGGGATAVPSAGGTSTGGGSAVAPAAGSARAAGTAASANGPSSASAASGGSARTSAAQPAAGGSGGSAPASGGAAPTPGVPGGDAGAGVKGPVVIGSITHLSGPAASGTLPALDGLQIWVKYIAAKGGLNGHPVKLIVADDNTDSARHRQLTQEMVEQKGVMAFLQQGEALTGASSVPYNTEHGIAVINSSGGNDYYYEAPDVLPHRRPRQGVRPGQPLQRGRLRQGQQPDQVRGAGLLRGADLRHDTDQVAGDAADVKAAGLELVYKARVSLVQPDFTAECIQARNAGVRDPPDRPRRQRRRPGGGLLRPTELQAVIPNVFGAIAFDKMKDNPDLDGINVNGNSFPYFLCDDPRTKEYCDAYQRFGPAKVYGIGNTNGWMAGKALERATRSIPEPSAKAILEGMWTFKDETLGGLVQPLTFTKGQNAPRQACWWPIVLDKGKWTAPNGVDVKCR